MTCIICELNPIHNGHQFLIDKAMENGPVVLIMSGNFTQRGSPAIYDKYTRARAAVMCGADLVLELPFPWCSAGAADFAKTGVAIAKKIGADKLVFGSGSGNAELLSKAGVAFAETDFDSVFAKAAKADREKGAALVREEILTNIFSEDEANTLSNPNDILGIEYFRYSHALGGLKCIPVKRAEGGDVISATAIRKMIADGYIADIKKYIPNDGFGVLSEAVPVRESVLYDIERILFRLDKCDYNTAAECEGGLGYRLRNAAGISKNGAEMLSLAATKKYTDARIRRGALYASLGITRDAVREIPRYTSVLAIGKSGGGLLRQIKKSGAIEVLTKAADYKKLSEDAQTQFRISARADRLYTVLMDPSVHEEYFLSVTPHIEK